MANKPRTPPPPRRVQAPKVRTGNDRKSAVQAGSFLGGRLSPQVVAGTLGVLVVAGVLIGVFATRGGGSSASKVQVSNVSVGDMTTLPGILLTRPPWGPNTGKLRARLDRLGLQPLAREALAFHIHAHVDVFDNGSRVTVPGLIGISAKGQFLTTLHTHDTRGVMHIESPIEYAYTLGQFFGVWGVRLSRTCIGGLCAPKGQSVHVWVGGKPFTGNPTQLVLSAHEEIAVAYGTPPPKIPSSYNFSSGE